MHEAYDRDRGRQGAGKFFLVVGPISEQDTCSLNVCTYNASTKEERGQGQSNVQYSPYQVQQMLPQIERQTYDLLHLSPFFSMESIHVRRN